MTARGWGRIVYVSSDSARAGAGGEAIVRGDEGRGLFGFAKSLATGARGVTANVELPGPIDTARSRAILDVRPRLAEPRAGDPGAAAGHARRGRRRDRIPLLAGRRVRDGPDAQRQRRDHDELMASFELVDAHVHLWDLAHRWYPAMQEPAPGASFESLGDVARMARDFLDEYRAETASCEVLGLVHVSAVSAPRAYLQETPWVDRLLDGAGVPSALIGALDPGLSRAEAEADLDAQAAASARLRGVRVLSGIDPGSRMAADLCELLLERGLLLDLVAHPGDVAGLRPLLERFADSRSCSSTPAGPTASSASSARRGAPRWLSWRRTRRQLQGLAASGW